jgi:hypothetical protein
MKHKAHYHSHKKQAMKKTYAKPSPQQKKLNSSRRVAQRRNKRKVKHLTKTKDLPSLQAAYHLKNVVYNNIVSGQPPLYNTI